MKQVSNKKLAVVSRATVRKAGDMYRPVILIEQDKGKWDTWEYIQEREYIRALDKAHYDNANTVQFGHEISGAWLLTHHAIDLNDLKGKGYQL